MVLVDIRDAKTRYILTAEIQNGDLVFGATDLTASIKQAFGTDAYEYFYIVKAPHLGHLNKALGGTEADMLERLRDFLGPHGYSASTLLKKWLDDQKIPYDFSVWR